MANKGKAKKQEGLDESTLKLLTPIGLMKPVFIGKGSRELCEKIITDHSGQTYAEIKEDGYRMQIHKKGDVVEGFTSSLSPANMKQFPEIKLDRLPDCILDCEITGADKPGISGYEDVKKRFRFKMSEGKLEQHLSSGIVEQHRMKLRVFDTLYWDDKFLVNRPLSERRTFTECIDEPGIGPSKLQIMGSGENLWNLFSGAVGTGEEGLVCKNPGSIYIPGDRKEWIKVKRAETLDLAVLGVYMKDGRVIEVLCGTFNKGVYETLAKINAKTEGIGEMVNAVLKKNYVKSIPNFVYMNPSVSNGSEDWPTYFIKPEKTMVLEVDVINFQYGKNCYSCGLKEGNAFSVRSPVLKRVREDKKPEMATSTDKVRGFYFAERRLKN